MHHPSREEAAATPGCACTRHTHGEHKTITRGDLGLSAGMGGRLLGKPCDKFIAPYSGGRKLQTATPADWNTTNTIADAAAAATATVAAATLTLGAGCTLRVVVLAGGWRKARNVSGVVHAPMTFV